MKVRIGEGSPFELAAPGLPRSTDYYETLQLTLEEAALWATTLRNRLDDERVRRREAALRCAAGHCGLVGQLPLRCPETD